MKKYIVLVYLVSLAITLYYAYVYAGDYLARYDARRDYEIFKHYQANLLWHPMNDWLGLQNTSIFTNYIPALIHHIVRFDSRQFYTIYLALGVAVVPVIAYLVACRIIDKKTALFAPLYVIGWVAFYQGMSYSRLNFALIFFGLLVLLILSNNRHRLGYSVGLAVIIPFAHYGTALVAMMILGGYGLVLMLKHSWHEFRYVAVVASVMLVVFSFWHGVVNQETWVQHLSRGSAFSLTEVNLNYGQSAGDGSYADPHLVPEANPYDDTDIGSIMSRDKIVQAALGVKNPDNDGSFQFSRWLLLFGWLTIVLMVVGAYRVLREKRLVYSSLVAFSFVSIIGIVAIPVLSRAYGVEKVFYQAILVSAPCVAIGGNYLAKRLHAPSWAVLALILLPYVALMWKYGIITSVLG